MANVLPHFTGSKISPADAETFIRACVLCIGLGFHPDTPAADYRLGDRPSFTADEARRFQNDLDAACEVLGSRVYDVCLDAAAPAASR